jgi:acetolactate synthase II small subunit
MKAELRILLNTQLGSLERVLRVVRHRGFRIITMQVTQMESGLFFDVALCVESERSVLLLAKPLNKLLDVLELRVVNEVSYAKTA